MALLTNTFAFEKKSCRTKHVGVLVFAVALTACSMTKAPSSQSGAASPPPAASVAKAGKSTAKAVNIKADCAWKDETGYNGKMKLQASNSVVQDFSAAVNHPKHGSCSFAMKDFRQVKEMPNVELKGTTSPCTVRMWTQGRQVSVAFSSCKAMCTGDAVDYLWPILANASNGSCG